MTNLIQQQKQVKEANKYWGRRLEDINHVIENLHEYRLRKLLLKEYKRSQREIESLVSDLYIDMLESGGITPSSLYEYSRFKALSARFNKEIKNLGGEEVNLVKAELEQAYMECFGKTSEAFGIVDFTLPNTKAIERVVAAEWLGDNYSNRIWKNKTKLLNKLEINIKNCVSLGMSKDKAVKDIMQTFGSSFSDADRLIRSELMHTNNAAQIDVARKANYKTKIWLTAKDERVCKICGPLNGIPFPIDADMFDHARGRCTWIFSKEDIESSNEVIENEVAKNKNGEEIKFKLDGIKKESQDKVIEDITWLSNEYNTNLKEVRKMSGGGNGTKAQVDYTGETLELATTSKTTIVHEFAHTLTTQRWIKDGYSNADETFWKEISKIKREYSKEIKNPYLDGDRRKQIYISNYAMDKKLDEFMAEGFARSKLDGMYDFSDSEYNENLSPYAVRVLETVDKYFKKE